MGDDIYPTAMLAAVFGHATPNLLTITITNVTIAVKGRAYSKIWFLTFEALIFKLAMGWSVKQNTSHWRSRGRFIPPTIR